MVIRKTLVTIILGLVVCLLIAWYAGISEEVSSTENAPETCTLGRLAKIYEPVEFPHEMHTYVTEDCASCHHHSQEGETPSCSECHNASSAKERGIKGLKEAYHGNCIVCHREMETGPTGCADCHVKKTIETPKLSAVKKRVSKDGPEFCNLDNLEDEYDPVTFSHEMHTQVTEDCATCHHHSPAGQTSSCGTCHGAPFDPGNLNMPGLKGAYHLQCMGCHKEMDSGPMGCTECHAKKAKKLKSQKRNDD